MVVLVLLSLVLTGAALRTVDLGTRGYFIPDEDISIKSGNYFLLGNATGYGLKFVNGTLDLTWPHPYNYEHPPLGKIFIGVSGLAFGHTAAGYRLLGALLGTALVVLVFLLARKFMSNSWALVPAAVASFDPLLVQLSRVATPDIYFLFFAVSAFVAFIYLRGLKGVTAAGILMGMSVASKWLGLYALLALLLYQLISGRVSANRLLAPIATILIAAGVYVASYFEYFIGGPVYQIGAPAPSYLLLGPHTFPDFVQLQLWMAQFTLSWHVAGTSYGYVFMSTLTYVLPGVSTAPIYAFDIALFGAVPLAALAYLSRTRPPSLLVLWCLSGLIPLFDQGFVWYLAYEIPGAALLMAWFASSFQTETKLVRLIPVLLLVGEAVVFLSYLPR
jgi:hypothetical protein